MEQKTPAQNDFSPKSVSVMRNHKDTVFRLLYKDKKELLSLYNALNGTNYTDESLLHVETLEHAIYMGVKDDVAFLLDSRLNIYEQQASYFVETVRKFKRMYPVEKAVSLAVDKCIENDVLREFFTSQKAKVIQMSLFEFDVDEEIRKLRKSEFNYGKDVGREEGISGVIRICRDFRLSKEQTLIRIMESVPVNEKTAAEYLEKYWED